jgi:hypothetical protein
MGTDSSRWLRGVQRFGRLLADACRVMAVLWRVEVARRQWGAGRSLAHFRESGRNGRNRNAAARADLQRLIRFVDRLMPGRPNCFRRVLLEVALEPAAAAERVMLGLKAGLAQRSGHAWLENAGPAPEQYDTQLSV